MEEQKCKFEDKIAQMASDMKDIKKLLMGNGVIGVVEQARRAFEYCQWHKASKNGLLDWAFRAIITLGIGFIAMKVGLK